MGAKRSKSLRYIVIKNSFNSILSSSFVQILLLFSFSGVTVLCGADVIWTCIAFASAFVFSAALFRVAIFDGILISHVIGRTFGYFDWFNEVDDGLYLGAIPLLEHINLLTKDLEVDLVLSVVEDFELGCAIAVGRSISKSGYNDLSIEHKQIVCRDNCLPTFNDLDIGANELNQKLMHGKKVYCHCKSGSGRSACIVMAYFIKFKQQNPNDAYKVLKSRRKEVFKASSKQMKHMVAYAAHTRRLH